MDIPAVMREIDAWPVEDRIRLLEALWERLGNYSPEISAEDRAELDRRLDAYEADPEKVLGWEQVEADAKRAG